ncbi:uncharacterized protein PV06_03527 [Exophiala oligosperma]|uniref:Major facilitator superfamily (MFS) profile domain-containing protein n=1 Tax=Exophiala oligosperma TaxID=215243 RepID=A0A0D2DQG4_9EURO|nr:uncharacterized protein PV06_03527 [Exophiala oligosperma]KIW45113.1 hypothetical protein PV06_03527 [Exophiala oligosperma]
MRPEHPPGTIPLLERQAASEALKVVLVPHPSNDPNDPLNWNNWRKAFNYLLVLAATLASFTGIMIQPVLWPQMVEDMKMPITAFQHGQSANLAGLATGCALFVPLTIKYGRRSTYIASVAVMAAGCWWTARRTSYAEVILTSIIIGWAGAINETVVQMTIADLYFIHQRGRANAFYQLAVVAGGFLTPVAAGAQATAHGWRWCYYTLGITQTILAIVFLFGYEETKYNRVSNGLPDLQSSVQLDGVKTSLDQDQDLKEGQTDVQSEPGLAVSITEAEIPAPNTYWQRMRFVTTTPESLWRLFIAPVSVLFLPHVLFTAIQYSSSICWLVLYSATSPIIFSAPPYLFTASGLGNLLLGPLVGTIIGSAYAGILSDRLVVWLAKRNHGVFEPEMRLHLLLPVYFAMGGGLIIFGVTAAHGLHWIYPSIGGALFGFGFSAMGDITFTMVIDIYYELTAEAFVGVTFVRNAISIAMPFTVSPWLKNMGMANMFIVVGCLCFGIGMAYVPLLIYGKRIRTALGPRYYKLVEKRRFY